MGRSLQDVISEWLTKMNNREIGILEYYLNDEWDGGLCIAVVVVLLLTSLFCVYPSHVSYFI